MCPSALPLSPHGLPSTRVEGGGRGNGVLGVGLCLCRSLYHHSHCRTWRGSDAPLGRSRSWPCRFNALVKVCLTTTSKLDKAGTCLSHELCSSVKHPPKHMQRPRQHADAGFRGSLVRGIDLWILGVVASRNSQGRRVSSRPRAGPVVSFAMLSILGSNDDNRPKDGEYWRQKAEEQSKLCTGSKRR